MRCDHSFTRKGLESWLEEHSVIILFYGAVQCIHRFLGISIWDGSVSIHLKFLRISSSCSSLSYHHNILHTNLLHFNPTSINTISPSPSPLLPSAPPLGFSSSHPSPLPPPLNNQPPQPSSSPPSPPSVSAVDNTPPPPPTRSQTPFSHTILAPRCWLPRHARRCSGRLCGRRRGV